VDREQHPRPQKQRSTATQAEASTPAQAPEAAAGRLLVASGMGVAAGAAAAVWLAALRVPGEGLLLAVAAVVLGLMLGRAGWQLRRGVVPSASLSDRIGVLSAGLGASWASVMLGQILGATDLFSGIRGTEAANVPLIMVCFVGLPLAVLLASRIADTLRSAERLLDGLWWYGLLTAGALCVGGVVVAEPLVSGFGVAHPSSGGISTEARAGLVVLGLVHLVLPLVVRRLRAGLVDRLRDDLDEGW
jgi:hypothetical protein